MEIEYDRLLHLQEVTNKKCFGAISRGWVLYFEFYKLTIPPVQDGLITWGVVADHKEFKAFMISAIFQSSTKWRLLYGKAGVSHQKFRQQPLRGTKNPVL